MGLSNILNIASTGLAITQANLDIVARNVANADTPGYTAKSIEQKNVIAGEISFGVRQTAITRAVDAFLQSQIRVETSALNDVDVRRQFLERLDELFGQPGGANALDTLYNKFTQSLQELTSTPEQFSSRQQVVNAAQVFAQRLQQLSGDVQALRQHAEDSLSQAVSEVNEALTQLKKINDQIRVESAQGVSAADLLDERDKFVNRVSEFLEIRVVEARDGTVSVFTQSGNALLENEPVALEFDHRGDISANALYSAVDADRGVGTITLTAANGFQIDLIRNGILDSGRIGALIELRDDILVDVQAQLDELAHGLATSLSNTDVASTAVTAGTQLGFDIDTAGVRPGNVISLNFTVTPPGTTQSVSIVRVDDASVLPLGNDVTPDPNDIVIGVDFSGGLAAVATALNTELDAAGVLGDGITVSAPGGSVLRFLDDTGVTDTTVIDSVSATVTSTAVQDAGTALPLFVDGGNSPAVYSGALEGAGQKTGFAARITVNAQIRQNNELLVRYASSPETPLGDTTRPFELLNRLTENSVLFSASAGIGTTQSPFSGTIGNYVQRIISVQTGKASDAAREFAAQDIVVTALRDKFQRSTGVDMNKELSDLIELQNSFAANARIIQAVDEMLSVLFQSF